MAEENGLRSSPRGAVVSLDLELGTLATAIQSARMLADLQARHDLPDAEMERNAPACIVSVLALATERLGQLRRVVRNEEDPASLWAPHNAVEAPETSAEFSEDIVLFSWGSDRLPLVMWGTQEMAPSSNTKKAPKQRERRERRMSPAPSNAPQSKIQREPAPSEPVPHETRLPNN